MYFIAGCMEQVWVSLSGSLAEHSIRPAFCKYIILPFTWLMFCFKVKWWQTTYYWKEAFKLEVIHHGYVWPFTEGHKAKCFYSVINAAAWQNTASDGTDVSCPDLREALSHTAFLLPRIRIFVCRCFQMWLCESNAQHSTGWIIYGHEGGLNYYICWTRQRHMSFIVGNNTVPSAH